MLPCACTTLPASSFRVASLLQAHRSAAILRCARRRKVQEDVTQHQHQRRRFGTQASNGQEPPAGKKGGLQAKTSGQGTAVTVAQKVVEGSKDAGYGLVILGGVVILGAAAYHLFSAGFGSTSPQHVYSQASDLLRRDPEVQKVLGPNIKTYGEETSRRRRGLQSVKYMNPTTQREHVRIIFTAEGDINAADVIAEVTSSGQFYLLTVEVPVTGEKLAFTNAGKFERR